MSPFTTLCPWLVEPLQRLELTAAAGKLGHGWLISGPSGSGKANLVYVLAARLLSRDHSAEFAEATARDMVAAYATLRAPFDLHPDLHRVFANDPTYKKSKDRDKEKRTISVEQIRDLTAELSLTSHIGGRKVVIIEQAERMTIEAANALLKSLEEPTAETYLFLIADRPGRLPATIRSRCQQLPLKLPAPEACRDWLEADGLNPGKLPAAALRKPPIAQARLLTDDTITSNYKAISDEIKVLFSGRTDPHELASRWQFADTELALGCLIEDLHWRIRSRLAPEPSKPVTDRPGSLEENPALGPSTEALFAGLKMAENLRDQIGRGTNVELALKALLLGLDPAPSQGVNA
jgi:DNA polymerase-3 subunit delta'